MLSASGGLRFLMSIDGLAEDRTSSAPLILSNRPGMLEPVMNFVVIVKLLDDQNRLS